MVVQKRDRPTTADVARAANVSVATVSYVLNNVEGQKISDGTRSAVWAAAEELGYRRNLAARNLKAGGSGVVLFIIPQMGLSELAIQVGSRLTAALVRHGIMLSLQFETDNGHNVVEAIADLDPVAVASTFPLTGEALAAVESAGILQIHLGSPHLQVLATLNRTVAELQVDHLFSRGHRRLGFAHSDLMNLAPVGDFWLTALRDAAHRRQLPDIAVATVATDGTDAAEVVGHWVAEGVTAVCAHTDPTAFIVLHGLRQAGLRCPHDLAVIGLDNTPTGYVSDPPLTSVEFDGETILGAVTAGYLGALGYPADPPPTERAVAHLVVRAST